MAKFYATTPAYYPNDIPHIGHAYTTIATDVVARWQRLKLGKTNVMFISGLDEHGSKIEKAAKEKGLTPQQFVDSMAEKFMNTWKTLDISYDRFIRTSERRHQEFVLELFKKTYANDDIYKGVYEGWYCTPCESYWTENQLVHNHCPSCGRVVEMLKEESYFFRLSRYQKQLLELYEKSPGFILPAFRKKEIVNRIKDGLKDLSISRKNVTWGIPVPIDKEFTLYVWLDALSFYISVLGYKSEVYKKFWPPDVQFMAKEILWFHAVIFPALLLSAKIMPLPQKIFAHGWLTVNGQKMSKSLGNATDPLYLVEKYGVDALRYYLLREIPFGEDGDFSEEALKVRVNTELNNDLGNLVSRVLTLVEKQFPTLKKCAVDKKLAEQFDLKAIETAVNNFEFHVALAQIWKYINDVNRHINQEKLWELKGTELQKHLYTLVEALRIISIVISPFIPETAEKINKQLGVKAGSLKDCAFGIIREYKAKRGALLFQKL